MTTIANKLNILYLYKRAFTTLNRIFAWSLYTLTVLQIDWAVTVSFVTIFQCWRIDMLWRADAGTFSDNPTGNGIDLIASLTSLTTIKLVLNTDLLLLPMAVVWHLHTSRKTKLALSAIFALSSA